MPDVLLATKINPPKLRHILITRKQVLRRLSEGIQNGHLLTLVSAPAGYGKTTTLRMWVEEAGHPIAWVTLEKSDNDPKQFLTYVLTALGGAVEHLGQSALEMVENAQEVNLQAALGMLINDLCGLDQPIILVLEEYHLIENETLDRAVEFLLNQAVGNLHVVIATREDPSLPLTRLRVRNQLTEIRAADLSFSLEEAGEFFSNVMGVNISEKETEILKDKTEGWAAGLQLAALSLRESQDTAKFVEAFDGTHRHILDYLIEETLNSQPEEMREFLRRTSILDQLSASLCEAVTGQWDSRKYLQYLENNNLFLVSVDEKRTWYRYHALFGELLKNQLLQVEPERVDDLHERAARWYEKHGFIQKAIEHAFQISSGSTVSGLIEKYALPMIYQGEVSTVMGWFDRMPESLMGSSPMLGVCKAWSLALMLRRTGRTEKVEKALQAAEEALNRTNADEALRNLVAGHIASIQAFSVGSGDLSHENAGKLIEAAQKAQQLLPKDEKAIRSVNAMIIGNGYLALADLPAAEKAFTQTFEDGLAGGNFYAAVYGPINLILIAMKKGQLKNALESCEANISRFNQLAAGQRFPPIGALHILKGCILLETNLLAGAEQELAQGLSLIRWTGEYRTHVKGYSAQARLRSIQGDRLGMSESMKLLEETRPEFALYAHALGNRFSLHDPVANTINLEEAHRGATQEAIKFGSVPDITGVDLLQESHFEAHLSTAHYHARLAARYPQADSLSNVHKYFARQEKFAESCGLVSWLIEIWILRALMYHVEGRAEDARRMIESALGAAAARGYFRIFLDEGELMCSLLKSVAPRLKDSELSDYAKRLLAAMPGESEKVKPEAASVEILTEREVEVLRLLAAGESYKEIGQNLFLSLNTVQFHVKNIYSKFSVNRRAQAVEKAREMKLI